MTEDTSPENLRKFLESDDPAMVRMGLSMAKGSGVPEELLPTILGLYMWDDDKTIRAAAKSVFTKYAPPEIQTKVKENWKPSYRTLLVTGGKINTVIKKLVDEFKSQEQYVDAALCPFITALGDENWWLRHNAVGALLGVIDETRAVEPLIKALERGNSAAADALGKIGDTQAVEPLIKALSDEAVSKDNGLTWEERTNREKVRSSAANALGVIGDTRAVEPLIKALGDDRGADRNGYVVGALREIGEPAVEPLIKALSDNNWKAVWVLGKIGDTRAVRPLIKTLQVTNRGYAVGALGEIGDGRAIEPLIKMLEDEDEYVRGLAKEVLKKLGHEVE